MAIKSIEWLGFYEASVVAVKTQWMLDEIVRIYKVPKEKIKIVSSNCSRTELTIYDSLKWRFRTANEKRFNVMMLSWEFPPRIIGGISPHVYFLSKSLVKQGVNVHVVTCDFPNTPNYEVVDGIEVHRIDSYKNPSPDFPSWIYLMNINMQKEAARLVRENGNIDIFHAHDWLVANAGIGLETCVSKTTVGNYAFYRNRQTGNIAYHH